jgi:hypothetical protein
MLWKKKSTDTKSHQLIFVYEPKNQKARDDIPTNHQSAKSGCAALEEAAAQ